MAHTHPIRRLGLVLASLLLMGIAFPAAAPTPASAAAGQWWLIQPSSVQGTVHQVANISYSNTLSTATITFPTSTALTSSTGGPTGAVTYLIVSTASKSYGITKLTGVLITGTSSGVNTFGKPVETVTVSFEAMTQIRCAVAASGATVASCKLPASRFAVAATPTEPAVNSPVSLQLVARDIENQRVRGYRGTVHFTASSGMTLPSDYTFTSTDAGAHLFKGLKMPIVGTYRVTARDTTSGLPSGSKVITVY